MTDYKAFLNGCKPSYLCENDSDEFKHLTSHNYPSAPVTPEVTTIFFHSQDLRDKFVADMEGVELGSYQYYIVLGEALGFPPIAAKFFADYMENRELEKHGAVFNYAGRHFAGHIDDAEQIAKWLWENVENFPPSPVKVTYQGETFSLYPVELCYTK